MKIAANLIGCGYNCSAIAKMLTYTKEEQKKFQLYLLRNLN
jgi:hypothetical protein